LVSPIGDLYLLSDRIPKMLIIAGTHLCIAPDVVRFVPTLYAIIHDPP
jgi:hypothetical protein